MTVPLLDSRDPARFYEQALALARLYVPEWSGYWPQPPEEPDPAADPGLVLLKLFSSLAAYTSGQVNMIPAQRQLAFFQFLDMRLRAPLAARAPLHFTLAPGRSGQLLKAGTAVLAQTDQAIRFETGQDLQVLPATLSAAITVMPSQDAFIDVLAQLRAGGPQPLFVADAAYMAAEQPFGHWFLIGDPTLFQPGPALQSLTLKLTGQQLYPEYFGQWFDAELNPLATRLTAGLDYRSLQVEFTQLPRAGIATAEDLDRRLCARAGRIAEATAAPAAGAAPASGYWLLVSPASQVQILDALSRQLPVVTGVECVLAGSGIQPSQAASNQVLVELANGVYPFGATPARDDAFYLRADSVFSRQGAVVTLEFALAAVGKEFPVTLHWQFWDGQQWASLNATPDDVSRYQFVDTTDALRYNNPTGRTIIRFLCPPMAMHTVAGTSGLWLRAVIADGGYGAAGGFEATPVATTIGAIPEAVLPAAEKPGVISYLNDKAGVNFSYRFDHSAYYPPFIRALSLAYSFAALPGDYRTWNAFELAGFQASPYRPAAAGALTAFHFGFDPAGFIPDCVGKPLDLFIQLDQEEAAPDGTLDWHWYDGQAWQALAVDDGSKGLSRNGIIRIQVPAAMPAARLFGQTRCWFRAVHPRVERTILVGGIYPNTVMASNVTTVAEQVVGSSNEAPSQQFSLAATPLLDGLELEVAEPPNLNQPSLPEQITQVELAAPAQASGPVRRRWSRVANFSSSGPAERVYTLDCRNGLVTFGDGRNGMIPPRGMDNIIAVRYQQTQGLAGNVPAGVLTVLRPGIGAIAAVVNPAPADGGAPGDSRALVAQSSPALVKASHRAVDLDDLTALAAASSAQVARAQAVQDADQRIRIAVLAQSPAAVPYSSPALLREVSDYVRARCLAPLAARIVTQVPSFVPVAVVAQLRAGSLDAPLLEVQQRLAGQLRAFLHPVTGGAAGDGWQFGVPVRAAQVQAFLAAQPGVAAVLALALNGRQDGEVVLAPTGLPVAGDCAVYLLQE